MCHENILIDYEIFKSGEISSNEVNKAMHLDVNLGIEHFFCFIRDNFRCHLFTLIIAVAGPNGL